MMIHIKSFLAQKLRQVLDANSFRNREGRKGFTAQSLVARIVYERKGVQGPKV